MYPLKLKTEIYQAIAAFLDAYKRQDTQTLAEQFDIHGGFLEEIDEMLDFIEDKTKLRLFPLEEMDKFECGGTGLSIFGDLSDDEEEEEDKEAEPESEEESVGVEAKLYEEGEAKAIVRLVLETRFELSLADICAGKVTHLSQDDGRELEDLMQGLALGHPVQYVLGEALFAGRTFRVTPDVLIPRPETEELCQWVVQTLSSTSLSHPRILDIGTGSGCIAITLAQSLPSALVCGWDISKEALAVARENADRWGSAVEVTASALAGGQLPGDDRGRRG